MADAVPGDTAPGDPELPHIEPALFLRLAADPLAERLGKPLERVGPGHARAVVPVGPDLLEASNSHGTVARPVEFLASGRPGDRLTAEGVEPHRGSRTAVHRLEARADDGRLVATALARVFRTDRPWEAA